MDSPHDQPDQALLNAFVQDCCERSFTTLVRRHAGLVCGVAGRTLDQLSNRDDVCQLTFLQLAKKAHRLRSHGQLVGWLHKTAYQQALNLNRGQRRAQAMHLRFQKQIATSETTDSTAPTWHEIAPLIDQELAHIKETDRSLLVKRYLEGCSVKEVAGYAGISISAAEKRLQRTLAKLRDRLGSRGFGFTAPAIGAALLFGGSQDSMALTATTGQWVKEALLASKKSPSLISTFIPLIIMKKALTLLVILLMLTPWWTQSTWSPFLTSVRDGAGVSSEGDRNTEALSLRARRVSNQSRTAKIHGKVTDRVSGEVLAGAEVSLHIHGYESETSAFDDSRKFDHLIIRSDDDGNYTISLPDMDRALRFSMQVSREGYTSNFTQTHADLEGAGVPVDEDKVVSWGLHEQIIRSGMSAVVDFEMTKSAPLTGFVVDKERIPVAKVKVQLWHNREGGGGGTTGSATSDEEGKFEIWDSPQFLSRGKLELELIHPDFAPAKVVGVHSMTEEERGAIKVILTERNLIEGVVFDPQGSPVVGATVCFRLEKVVGGDRDFVTFTGAEGRFEMKLVETGRYSVEAIEFGELASFSGQVEIAGEGEMDLHLEASQDGKREAFQLFDLHFTPLSVADCSTFGREKSGGLLVNKDIKKGRLTQPLKKGNLVRGAVDFDAPYSADALDAPLDLPSLARNIFDHVRYFEDGSAAAKIRISLGDEIGMTTNTLRFSKEDLAKLAELAVQ